MNSDQIFQDMAFAPYRSDLADHRKLRDALTTLYRFMQGQAKGYEITGAVGYLEQKYGTGVLAGCNLVRVLVNTREETARDQLCYECISLIESSTCARFAEVLDRERDGSRMAETRLQGFGSREPGPVTGRAQTCSAKNNLEVAQADIALFSCFR